MAETPRGAILQRDKETYAIVPRSPVGLLTADNLEALAKVVRKYNIPVVKITSGQRVALVGIKGEDVEKVWNDLGMDPGKATELCVHYAQACPGTAVCRFGVQDSLGLGLELEKYFEGVELPAKLKFGVSGCPFCCAESYVRDLGIIGKKSGWTVAVGGNSGGRPRIGEEIAQDLTTEQVMDLCRKCLDYYRANAKKKERMSAFVDRVGLEAVKKAVI